MEYQIMVSDELILVDAAEIQHHFKLHPIDNLVDDMLLRASNQSLLADVFPILTIDEHEHEHEHEHEYENQYEHEHDLGESCGIIRSQFLATAVATKCRFVLDMRDEHQRTTQVECTLVVSVPYPQEYHHIETGLTSNNNNSNSDSNKNKLDIASVRLMVQFSPEPSAPFVKYHLVSINPMLDVDRDREKIHAAAKALEEMMADVDQHQHQHQHQHQYQHEDGHKSAAHYNHNHYNYNHRLGTSQPFAMTDTLRDNFLQSIATTQSGLRSALRDIDGVVNVSSKLDYLKKVSAKALPVLPSAEEIIMASQVEAQGQVEGQGHGQAGGVPSDVGHVPQQQGSSVLMPPPLPGSSLGGSHSVHDHMNIDAGQSTSSLQSRHPQQHPQHPQHPPKPPHQHPPTLSQHKQTTTSRPIIGGLLLSGISHLAEAVAAPSDHNTNSDGNDTSTVIPKLYRKDDDVINQAKNINHQYDDAKNIHNNNKIDNNDNGKSTIVHGGGVRMESKIGLHGDVTRSLPLSSSTSNGGFEVNGVDGQANRSNNNGDAIVGGDGLEDEGPNGWSDDDDELEVELASDHGTDDNVKSTITPTATETTTIATSSTNEDGKNDKGQPQLKSRQKHLIATMKGLMERRIVTDTYVDKDFVYDEDTGIIPTRRRFVSRSDMLTTGPSS